MKRHGISTRTMPNLILDAGAVYRNYGESNELLLGATRGGNQVKIEREMRNMEVDGAHGSVVGSQRITDVSASITANFLEFNSEVLRMALPGSVMSDYPATSGKTHDKIVGQMQIVLSDHWTNIAIVGEVAQHTYPVIFIIKNAIATTGLELSLADKNEAVAKIEFKAFFDSTKMDEEPWEIRYPSS